MTRTPIARKRFHLKFTELIAYLILTLGAILMLFPVVWMSVGVLKSEAEISRYPPTFVPENPTLATIEKTLAKVNLGVQFLNSTLLAVIVVPLSTLTSAWVGFVLAKYEFPGKKLMFGMLIATMLIPGTVLLVPRYQIVIWLGLVRIQLDNEQAFNALKFVSDLYHVDKVTDPGMPPMTEAFSSGVAAMIYEESWLASTIRRTNPDLKWFGVLGPTWSGTLKPTVGHLHFAVESVVNTFAKPEFKSVAWDYWHFLYSSDERLVKTIALQNGMLPCYDKLTKHPAVEADPLAKALVPAMDYGIMIGEVPVFYYDLGPGKMIDPVVLDSKASVKDVLKATEAEINKSMAQRKGWAILEREYKYKDLMLPNQP